VAGADPGLSEIRETDTHRLIPARYSPRSVLDRLTGSDDQLDELLELDAVTNDRLLGEANLLPGIGLGELLSGVRYAAIVNASFCHPHPEGSRFNGGDRGAWYAAFDLETARVEVAYHKTRELAESGWVEPERLEFQDYLADFHGEFHDLRGKTNHPALDPVSYGAGQDLARNLLAGGSAGIVYPSVRHAEGTCLACFRPALVTHVRPGARLKLTIDAGAGTSSLAEEI